MARVCQALAAIRFLQNGVLCKFTIDPDKLTGDDCSIGAFTVTPLSKYDIYSMDVMTNLKAENWRNRANATKYQSLYDKAVASEGEKFSHKYYLLKESLGTFFQNEATQMSDSEKDSFKHIMSYAKMNPDFCVSLREALGEEDVDLFAFPDFLRHATNLMVPHADQPSALKKIQEYAQQKMAELERKVFVSKEKLNIKRASWGTQIKRFLSKFKFSNIKSYFINKFGLFKKNWQKTKEFIYKKVAIDKLKVKAKPNGRPGLKRLTDMLSTVGAAMSLSLKSFSGGFDPYLRKLQKSLDGSDDVIFQAEEFSPDIVLDDKTTSKD